MPSAGKSRSVGGCHPCQTGCRPDSRRKLRSLRNGRLRLESAIASEVDQVRGTVSQTHAAPVSPPTSSCGLQIAVGDAADEILNMAHADDHDMIVLGSHEESAIKGLVLGAVHAKILHYAEKPVLIVRQFRKLEKVLVVYRGSQSDEDALKFTARAAVNQEAGIDSIARAGDRKAGE